MDGWTGCCGTFLWNVFLFCPHVERFLLLKKSFSTVEKELRSQYYIKRATSSTTTTTTTTTFECFHRYSSDRILGAEADGR